MTWIIPAALGWAGSIAAIAYLCLTAPEGYETTEGFFYGKQKLATNTPNQGLTDLAETAGRGVFHEEQV